MTKVSVEEVSPIERRIRVEIEPEVVQLQLENAYRMLSRQVRVPGFRPGKIPRRILEARYKDQVESDVIQHLVEHSYREAVVGQPDLFPVSAPRVTNEGLKTGEPFRYQAHVEIKPKVEPKAYDGLELKRAKVEIADAQVDAELEKLREALSELVPVEGRTSAQDGDYVVVDYEGTVEGKPIPGGKAEAATMQVAAGDFSEGHAAGMAGAAVGETRELEQTFAKDHRLAELAAKTAKFKVTLKALKTKKVPALDDELAKDSGGGTTLAELKDRIRKDLTTRETEKAEREVREQLVKQLIEKNPFDVPGSMVERAIDQMIEATMERFARQGIDPRRMNLDVDRMRDSLREHALVEVKGALLLEAIADKEKIEPTEQDYEAKVKDLAEKLKAPEEKVRAYLLGGEERRSVGHRIREEKTLAFLESKAKIAQA